MQFKINNDKFVTYSRKLPEQESLALMQKEELREMAFSQGADLFAVTDVSAYDDYLAEVRIRLQETGAGHKDYMNPVAGNMTGSEDVSHFAQLSEPQKSFPGTRTMIILGVYGYDHLAQYRYTKQELRGRTARIYGYYPVIRQIAESLVSVLDKHGFRSVHGQQIPLKFAADQIGLGVYGKNGILQHPDHGSYIALRCILTEAEFPPDQRRQMPSPCDKCDKCIKACPTGALFAPYKVNPKLCINPISRKEDYIEPQIRSNMQNWIVGCDICQEVCPSNKDLVLRTVDPRAGFDSRYHASHKNIDGFERTPDLIPLLGESQPFVIRRNAAIALANVGNSNPTVLKALEKELPNLNSGLKDYFLWAIEKNKVNSKY